MVDEKNDHLVLASVGEAIEASLLDPITVVQLRDHHLQELEEKKIGYLLLNEAAITQEDFFNLTPKQLQQVNQLKTDRALKVIEFFPIKDFTNLEPFDIKVKAINSDAMVNFIGTEQLGLQLAKINSADDLENFINTHRPQPSPSQKLKL